MIPVFAIGCLVLLLLFVLYGFGIIIQKPKRKDEIDLIPCDICRRSYTKDQLAEREVGDSRVLYFCRECIQSLSDQMRVR